MHKDSKIFIAGHRGLVGSSIHKELSDQDFSNLLVRNKSELDLLDTVAVKKFFEEQKPDVVFLAAAKVGGILANNTYRADFLYENLTIQNNVIHSAYLSGVKKLIFLGSSCIYPKNAPCPIKEDSLLTAPLEYTNEPYAIAKIAGLKLCESYNLQYKTNFISLMPTNMYGPNDNYNLASSHVMPALIRKIVLAKWLEEGKLDLVKNNLKDECPSDIKDIKAYLKNFGITKDSVIIWGSGRPRREFLHSSDLAKACVFVAKNVNFKDLIADKKEIRNTHINVGYGKDISIAELAGMIKDIVGFKGSLVHDISKPDGVMQKVMDVSKLEKLGFKPQVGLKEGVSQVIASYLESFESKQ
ncbi:GDP-L-fucose synthase [Helicobacter sp. 11S02629-2]|uniref:GDP-L-fucose synthase family protein n=1 Tax=Helicobacter sp. 11S02629-2 TaxID=1476195 RepID=UPI000BA5761B|nr:GDP-L-fucose synthase [Helicobacter sp. 11S02629-2]PAF45681.1 GDP-fucose synthetase [Helicobacter sp. 11S02629-2]